MLHRIAWKIFCAYIPDPDSLKVDFFLKNIHHNQVKSGHTKKLLDKDFIPTKE